GETAGHDGFTPLALAAAWTARVRLGTGIVNPFTRGPALLAQHAAALADLSGGRFVLGIGSSSNVIVERWNEVPFERPLTKVREAVETMRSVLAGGRGPGGFKLEPAPAHEIPIVVAALRGKMLALAAEVADGAFTNLVPLSGLPQVVDAYGAPDKELACRLFCAPQPEDEALALAKFMFAAYGTVPVYSEFYRWLGWGERVEPMIEAWNARDRARALELVPEDLVREIFVFGSPAQMRERLASFTEKGVSTLVLTPLCDPKDVPAFIDGLAPR
ncbi:MAG TPA: LLM class flavin-dependent oxidoreductase, partial [Solirubrobacteraceae bacterium]|nr:LLM class flavin-dependent oxidoreductase [Solirubrobacteraceae bacterium]